MVLPGILGLAIIVFGIGIYACSPSIPVAIALPASFLVLHIGGGGGGNNFSICRRSSLHCNFVCTSVNALARCGQPQALDGAGGHLPSDDMLSVINSPNRYDAVEWFHQILMVAGAAIVGWVIVKRGRVRMAFRGLPLDCRCPFSLGDWAMVCARFSPYRWPALRPSEE